MTNPMGDFGRSGEAAPDGHDTGTLTAQEVGFVEALARGETIRKAAELNQIPYSTARRWRKRPEIQSAIRELAREAVECGTLALGQGAKVAAGALRKIAAGKASASGPRVSACRAILEIGLRVLEVEEMERRLSELEARLNSLPGRN